MSNKVEICGINTNELPKFSSQELAILMTKIKTGDNEAKELFIWGNMRLVLSVVQRFGGRKECADDLFQVGCVGLIKAIDNFNTELNRIADSSRCESGTICLYLRRAENSLHTRSGIVIHPVNAVPLGEGREGARVIGSLLLQAEHTGRQVQCLYFQPQL